MAHADLNFLGFILGVHNSDSVGELSIIVS